MLGQTIKSNQLIHKKFIKTLREEPKTSSARKQAIWAELGRALAEVAEVTRGAASVIGNLLAFGRALRTQSAIVSGKSRWVCKAPDSLLFVVCRACAAWGSLYAASSRSCSRESFKEVLVVLVVRGGDRRSAIGML